MPRATFNALVKMATAKGLGIEHNRSGTIEVWVKHNPELTDERPGTTAVCCCLSEAYDTIMDYTPGQDL